MVLTMNAILSRKSAGWLTLLAVVLCGCGGSDGSKGKLAPVTGRVLFKGEGVTAAEIFFHPDQSRGNEGLLGTSVLQEDGSFTITTEGIGTGVRPGAYKVTLGLSRRPEKELNKFRNVKTTPLKYDVPEGGLTDLEIVLDQADEKAQPDKKADGKEARN
jgi:hypothetical protein